MTRRFSSGELSFLRNRIPINWVIENLNGSPRQKTNSKISFACPISGGFDTSINSVHNLARCFSCRQNFNPIEFVMHQGRSPRNTSCPVLLYELCSKRTASGSKPAAAINSSHTVLVNRPMK